MKRPIKSHLAPHELPGMFNEPNISWKAKGIITFIVGCQGAMDAERIAAASRDGIGAVRSGLKELEKAGYISY